MLTVQKKKAQALPIVIELQLYASNLVNDLYTYIFGLFSKCIANMEVFFMTILQG